MKKLIFVAALAMGGIASQAGAAVMPSGPQTNIAVSTVTNNWGWQICWSGLYGQSSASITSILAGCQGDNLMMAARGVGSDTFTVLAAAPRVDVIFDTGTGNTPHLANGTAWYFSPNYSWGFALAGDAISRNSCDTGSTNANKRLCWHTGGNMINGGWRAGTNTGLNGDNGWERMLLVSSNNTQVPEPAAFGLLGLGILGVVAGRRRKAA